jgi:hypothetical protein
MKRRTVLKAFPLAAALPGLAAEMLAAETTTRKTEGEGAAGQATGGATAVFELRVYTTYEGKLNDLLKRFREHTMTIFERHGMKNVAYWTPTDAPATGKSLIYVLKHPSREAAAANWKAFQDDPEWQQVRAKSEEKGKIVEKVESTFMVATDFSPKIG